MKCPHCRVAFHNEPTFTFLGGDDGGTYGASTSTCPACKRIIVLLVSGEGYLQQTGGDIVGLRTVTRRYYVVPRTPLRPAPPAEVPRDIADDFREACVVLGDSPKASAALSRRCLQHVLRQAAGVNPSDLAREIQEVLDSGKLPTHLAESIDAVRNIGNFSAHPLKSTSTGEILPVEPHEAEWNLDVLEALFDFYYVQPAAIAKKREALNKKLADAGKPPLKS